LCKDFFVSFVLFGSGLTGLGLETRFPGEAGLLSETEPLPEPMPNVESVVSAVASSKKYRTVCADTIRRIAERETANHTSVKAAVKATKRRLHQVYGAFEQAIDYDAAYQRLESAYRTSSEADIRATCRHVLGLHSSTRERLPILGEFYRAIFDITGKPGTIVDLGCGLNPLALPWMGLDRGARYVALDIDADRIRFLNRYLSLAGLEPLARCQDVLVRPPDDDADLALLLKMSPSLEQQERGSTQRLLERLRTPFTVVSFAVKSLGGREKGMLDHYGHQFLELAETQNWAVERLVFETELAFVVKE
jgi:16S rRNA (guanine(1405)-N(7))-methyltransferase